ncbi:MAG: hypothetical protein ACE5GH_02835, partial [Fidelibacterota bacterium]
RANGGESESPQWRYYLFPQPGIETNLTVVSVDVSSQLRLPDHLATVVGLVANQASDGREDVPIQLYFEDERVGQVVADFLPAQPKDFVFQAFPNRSGVVSGAMRIPHDDYEPDNQRFFQFTIPTTIRCKVAGPSNEDLSFLTYALSSINKDSQFVQWTQVSSQSVTTLSLDGTDVLILVDPASLKTSLVDETVKFVQRGGGIIAFMGELSSAREKSGLAATLSFPRPEQLVRLPDGSFHEVETVDRRHPLFENFPVADLSGELPRVFSHVKVMPGETARELLVLSNGDPFFMELEAHNARILLFTVLPNLRWSDFPLRGLFVPLLHRMLVYLVAEDGMGSNFEVGTHVEIPLRRDVVSAELQMLKPSGGRTFLVPDYRKEAVAVMDMDEAGVYRLLADGRRVASFVANISGTENPAARLAIKELSRIFPGNRTRVVGWKDDAKASVVDARRGTELWRPFLAAMLIVLILETWLGRVRREKTET